MMACKAAAAQTASNHGNQHAAWPLVAGRCGRPVVIGRHHLSMLVLVLILVLVLVLVLVLLVLVWGLRAGGVHGDVLYGWMGHATGACF